MEEKDKTSRSTDMGKENFDEQQASENDAVQDNLRNMDYNSDQSSVKGENNDSPESEVDELKNKLGKAEDKIKELNDQYVRSHAELENFKRRTKKEVSDFKRYAVESLVKQLLPIFDNLERAVFSAESSGESESCQITQGIKMTLKEIERVFEQFSIKPIEAAGEKFDPAYHMAVGQEERDDVEENTVVNQFQKGYMLHDRLIRPAMVTVAKPVQTNDNSDEENAEEPENNNDNQE
ncbi:MAG: nucleotide exchange factor GrpE [Thermodesulfobacteriota bacterium]